MSNRDLKPKKSAIELVKDMKTRGITFEWISEEEAIRYLSDDNNYLRTASYRKNYEKYQRGENKGKYLGLDFAFLKELSAIDMHLRRCLLSMCIDLEHAIKLRILNDIVNDPAEDAYRIVDDFLSSSPTVKNSIAGQACKFFTGPLINKYFTIEIKNRGANTIKKIDCPIWVLLEVLTFGDFIHFYDFYKKRTNKESKRNILNSVKDLRNACAHNNCLLADLRSYNTTKPNRLISTYISEISDIGSNSRKRNLQSRPIFDIVCLLYLQDEVMMPSKFKSQLNRLSNFINGRMIKNCSYFAANQQLVSSYQFIKHLVDFLSDRP